MGAPYTYDISHLRVKNQWQPPTSQRHSLHSPSPAVVQSSRWLLPFGNIQTPCTTAIRRCSLQQHDEDFVFHVVTPDTLEYGNWHYGQNYWHHADIWKQVYWKRRHVTLEYVTSHIRTRSSSVKDIKLRIRIYIIFYFPNFNRSWDKLTLYNN
jgi:hypothetical protein